MKKIILMWILIGKLIQAQTSINQPRITNSNCFLNGCDELDNKTFPQKVYLGGFISSISGIDVESGSVRISGFLWLKWKICSIDKYNTTFRPDLSLLITNTVDRTGTFTALPSFSNPVCDVSVGYAYQKWRIEGQFRQKFNFRSYPLDKHRILLLVQDGFYDRSELVYIPDKNDSDIGRIEINGWNIDKYGFQELSLNYGTQFGMIGNINASIVSQVMFFVDISRHKQVFPLRILLPITIAIGIIILVFLLDVKDITSKITGATGGLLTLMFLHLNFFSPLPRGTSFFTFLDILFIVTYIVTIGVIIETFVIYHYALKLRQDIEKKKQLIKRQQDYLAIGIEMNNLRSENKDDNCQEISKIGSRENDIKIKISRIDNICFIMFGSIYAITIIGLSIIYNQI